MTRARGGRLWLTPLTCVTVLLVAPWQARNQRVISLVPGATETLFALGAGEIVVGVSSFDVWPPQVKDLPRLGALVDPDLEGILGLRPDLVVVDPSQQRLAAQLGSVGIETYAYPTDDVDTVLASIVGLGAAIGRADAGDRLAARLEAELEALRVEYDSERRPTVLLVFGRATGSFANLYVNGGVGFLHDVIGLAGGANLFADVARPSFKAGLEVVLSRTPDVVLEWRPPAETTPEITDAITREWRALPGFGDVHVAVSSLESVVVPGPRLPEAVRALADQIRGS